MFWLWLLFCLLFSCLFEVLLGLHGVVLPVLLSVIFYFSCLLPWRRGFLLYFMAVGLLDSWFARALPCVALSLLGIIYFSGVWKRFGDMRSWVSLLVPGALTGLVSGGVLLLNIIIEEGKITATFMTYAVLYWLCSIILLPIIWALLENGAGLLSLRRLEVLSSALRAEEYSAREELLDE